MSKKNKAPRLKSYDDLEDENVALKQQLAEHESRWNWLDRSILALSKEGYSEWASVVLAIINKCRYEPLEEK
mgnify:CR=1 FL=1